MLQGFTGPSLTGTGDAGTEQHEVNVQRFTS